MTGGYFGTLIIMEDCTLQTTAFNSSSSSNGGSSCSSSIYSVDINSLVFVVLELPIMLVNNDVTDVSAQLDKVPRITSVQTGD